MTKKNASVVVNPYIADLTPYSLGESPEDIQKKFSVSSIIKLSSNENLLGPSLNVIQAFKTETFDLHLYPNDEYTHLKEAISKHLKLPKEYISLGNGSENCLENIAKTFLNEHSNAIVSQYVFAIVPTIVKASGAELKVAESQPNYGHDLTQMLSLVDNRTQLIFIVNPNNPTATYVKHSELVSFLNELPSHIPVVIDEAYYEYMNHADYPETLSLLKQYPNLIITRTFSKNYGLAGLRLGYTTAHPDITQALEKARLPFNVNSMVAKLALIALEDQMHVKHIRALTEQGKTQLIEGLKPFKFEYWSEAGNFITVNLKDHFSKIYQGFLQKGIMVRPLHNYGLNNFIRITVGRPEHNQILINALQELMLRDSV